MKKFVNIKDFGATKMVIPLKAGSKINEKGELIKLKQYSSTINPDEMSESSERLVYNDNINAERKHKNKKPKTKRCKCKKK